jgi:hypothetical protein
VTTHWRVPAYVPVLKITGAVLLLLVGLLFATDAVTLAVAVVAAAGLAVWGARDLLARERLAADETGLTVVTGFARRRHIPWAAVEKIAVERRPHAGIRTEALEIDTGDAVHLFSKHDLGAPPEEVAAALEAVRV